MGVGVDSGKVPSRVLHLLSLSILRLQSSRGWGEGRGTTDWEGASQSFSASTFSSLTLNIEKAGK